MYISSIPAHLCRFSILQNNLSRFLTALRLVAPTVNTLSLGLLSQPAVDWEKLASIYSTMANLTSFELNKGYTTVPHINILFHLPATFTQFNDRIREAIELFIFKTSSLQTLSVNIWPPSVSSPNVMSMSRVAAARGITLHLTS